MGTAAQFGSQISPSGLKLLELDPLLPAHLAGVSAPWRKLLLQTEMVAPHIQLVSIDGEQGAGKQTLARYLHHRSMQARSGFQRRDAREWLATEVDSSALSGFLYLDRVDLLSSSGQGLLLSTLKALQEKQAGRWIIAASSEASLRQMASQGHFLPDLAFRLAAVRLSVPPLRQRREDIAPLAQALLERICTRYQHRPVSLAPGTLACLLQHGWPGNVSELASVLEAALINAANNRIRPEDLPALTDAYLPPRLPAACQDPENLALDAVIRHHVHHVLDLNRGNKLQAARQLGISRSTLYRILGSESTLPY